MPVTPTYPGIYIEELPSSARTITAAPTSITVFVGYTHPFKTPTRNFNTAVRVFTFSDYEREFGGHYSSGEVDSNVALAVEEFFANGGSSAYVVGLQPKSAGVALTPPSATIGNITFSAREPTDRLSMLVTIDNVKTTTSPNDTADITITYGTVVETFRGVTLITTDANFIEKRLGPASAPLSSLVSISPVGAGYGAAFTAANKTALTAPPIGSSTFNAADYVNVFDADSSLDKVAIFNLMVLPGVADNGIWSAALAFCERKRAFLIMDPPVQAAADTSSPPLPPIETLVRPTSGPTLVPPSANGALYFPYLQGRDPITNTPIEVAPSGFVAGIYARTDLNRGVWKAPAGLETTLLNTTGVVPRGRMTDMKQGVLNPIGVNCLRTFPTGSVVFGARTIVTDNPAYQQWRYVPVRRMALFIEQTLYNSLGWAIFEPNDEPLWTALRTTIENFMLSLFSQGAFQGNTPSQAFLVKCDASTTTQTDIDNGIVNIIVGFRPLKPAEFVIVKIAQLAGQVQA